MQQKSLQSSVILRVFAVILTCSLFAVSAVAQEKVANVAPASQAGTVVEQLTRNQPVAASSPAPPGGNSAAGETDQFVTDSAARKTTAELPGTASTPATKSNDIIAPGTGNVSMDYKKTLNNLEALYEREVQKLEQQNNQAKGLYRDGLISRVEMEKSDKDLADARAKVEEARNQIAAANKPAPIAPELTPRLSDVAWTTRNNTVDNLVRFYGNKYGVDPYLIFCLMSQESKFSTIATSPKGAQGLMQLMPGTAVRYGVTNPYDVAQSISGGTRYLKDLLQMFNGRIDLALAGYNAGENAVIKHGYTVPPYEETRNYVRLITARYGKKQTSSKSARL
jgi:soluble lytic murein transglycosylase-like protein